MPVPKMSIPKMSIAKMSIPIMYTVPKCLFQLNNIAFYFHMVSDPDI